MHGTLKPQELAKVKGFSLEIEVLYCEEHAKASPEGVLAFSKSGIQIRNTEYTQTIARINNPTISLSSLGNSIWTDQCVVCGELTEERYQAVLEGATTPESESVEVPVCTNELRKLEKNKKANKVITWISILIGLGWGWATFMLKSLNSERVGVHLLCFSVVGVLGFVLLYAFLASAAAGRIGVDNISTWSPINIKREDEHYLLEFRDPEIAETLRRANGFVDNERLDLGTE